MGAWAARLRPSSPEGHDATRLCCMRMSRAARALSCLSVALRRGPGLPDVGADLLDPRAHIALHRLQEAAICAWNIC
jgi:hypothetical protein